MDQNPNNNPPSDVPAPDANPVVSPSPSASPMSNLTDLGGTQPPPIDPASSAPTPSPADPFPSPSGWGSTPGFPVQPDPGVSSPPAPAFDAGLDLSSGNAGSQSPSPAGAPTWATPQPVQNPLPDDDPPAAGPSDFGGASGFGAADPVPTFTPPAPETPTDSQPLPAFTPPVPGGDSLAAASGSAWPGAIGEAAPAVDQPDAGLLPTEPSVPQFPPTWPPEPSAPSTTSSFNMGASLEPDQSGEAGPTDLSHLMGSSAGGEIVSPQPVPTATTFGSPQSTPYQNGAESAGSEASANPQPTDPNPGASQVVTSSPSGGFPKWMLGVGALVLVVAIAASAYFILGVGSSSPEQQTSLPAEQAPLTNPPRAIVPSPAVQPSQASTSSASFGNLQGSAPQPSTPSGQSGASALELLRQRQGR